MERKKLSFTVFLIHKLAEAWGKTPSEVYDILEAANAIGGYIAPCYDTLHTLGDKYLVEDITGLVTDRGYRQRLVSKMTDKNELSKIYKQNLEESIILYLSKKKDIAIESAMQVFYKSKLAEQINDGKYGIENLDYKNLAEDLIENEAALFKSIPA